jgi:hypothetical protein
VIVPLSGLPFLAISHPLRRGTASAHVGNRIQAQKPGWKQMIKISESTKTF